MSNACYCIDPFTNNAAIRLFHRLDPATKGKHIIRHLTERSDRLQALREGYRVLKPHCPIFVAAISRFASALNGIRRGFLC